MKFVFLFLLSMSSVFASGHQHLKSVHTKADKLATAIFSKQKNHPWPYPLLSIGHNMQSFQNYGGSPYWHDGLDIRSVQDQPIYAAAGGKVVNVENYNTGPLYWEVAILDADGFVWKYHHVDRQSIPESVKEGASIAAGALIGNVARWPNSSFGERYHHLHLLVVGSDGKYINPFLMMEPLADTKAPVITKIGLAKNHRPLSAVEVSGDFALYVEASDLVLHDKYILPPHKISYSLDKGEEKLVWEFIHLPSGTNDVDFINDFFMQGTCGDYSCRKFYFNLNFAQNRPRSQMRLAPGDHEVDVTVEDVVGNRTSKNFKWKVL